MSSLLIRSPFGMGSIEFYERTPSDTRLPIERFKVRLLDHELSAIGRVYLTEDETNPADLFAQMAASWKGWQGSFLWSSDELALDCTQDRSGHVTIRVELRSGHSDRDWTVQATIATEAGQLEDLAHEAALFFESTG